MWVRIISDWQSKEWPAAKLEAGQVFEVATSLAIYWLALCAEHSQPRVRLS